VQYVVSFLHRAANRFQIVDASLDEGNLVADFREVIFLAGGQIVQYHDAFAAADKLVHNVSHSSNPFEVRPYAARNAIEENSWPIWKFGGRFPKTRENPSVNLKLRAEKVDSHANLLLSNSAGYLLWPTLQLYDERPFRKILKKAHVAGKL